MFYEFYDSDKLLITWQWYMVSIVEAYTIGSRGRNISIKNWENNFQIKIIFS